MSVTAFFLGAADLFAREARGENGKWMHKFVFLTLELTRLAYVLYFFLSPLLLFFGLGLEMKYLVKDSY